MSASEATLGPIGQCDLIFRLENKQFMDRFIVLQDLLLCNILQDKWERY